MAGSIVRLSDLNWEAMGEDPARGPDTRWKLVFSSDRTPTNRSASERRRSCPAAPWIYIIIREPEVYHVLEGTGIVENDGEPHAIEPGASVFIPGNAKHLARNTGGVPLRFLFVFPTDALRDVVYNFEE